MWGRLCFLVLTNWPFHQLHKILLQQDCIICVHRSFCNYIICNLNLNCLGKIQEDDVICIFCSLNRLLNLFEELLDGHVLLGVLKHNLGHGHLEILLGHVDSPLSQCIHTLNEIRWNYIFNNILYSMNLLCQKYLSYSNSVMI